MTDPLVSAIMPTHDRPEFVERSVELFFAQDYPNKELVVIDTGIKKVKLPPEVVHVDAGRNHIIEKTDIGMMTAKGKILIDWEDDEYYGPSRISAQAAPILAEKARVTGIGDPVMVWLPGVHFSIPRTWATPNKDQRVLSWRHGRIHEGTRCFRREVLKHFTPDERRSLSKVGWLHRVESAGNQITKIPNDGHWIHVRHGGNCVPLGAPNPLDHIRKPEWVPASQLDFWRKFRAPTSRSRRS
jgi:hypothetical protein